MVAPGFREERTRLGQPYAAAFHPECGRRPRADGWRYGALAGPGL